MSVQSVNGALAARVVRGLVEVQRRVSHASVDLVAPLYAPGMRLVGLPRNWAEALAVEVVAHHHRTIDVQLDAFVHSSSGAERDRHVQEVTIGVLDEMFALFDVFDRAFTDAHRPVRVDLADVAAKRRVSASVEAEA